MFHNEWEQRVFAMAVNLAEQGEFAWSDFQQQLIKAVADAEGDDPLGRDSGAILKAGLSHSKRFW